MLLIKLLAPMPALKELSNEPSLFNLANLFDGLPLYEVKVPAIIIFPSGKIKISLTVLLGPVPIENVLSTLPFEFSLTM